MSIPISAGKLIADTYGYDQVVIVARKVGVGGGEHVTTYGIDKAHCDVAARMGDFFKHKLMNWPAPVESQAAELAKLTAERDALRADAERYRWLRAHKPFTLTGFGYSEAQIEHWSNTQNEAKLDAAIDAARTQEKQDE